MIGNQSGYDNGIDVDASLTYCKNLDLDRDNITDGKEINGCDIKIITGWKLDETPGHDMLDKSPLPFKYFEEILSTAIFFYAFSCLPGL